MSGMRAALQACKAGRRTALIAKGRSLDPVDYSEFVHEGGALLLGDTAVEGVIDGGRVQYVRTENLGPTHLESEEYVLATGKFFGGGLVADMDSVREPLFGLDVDYEKDRSKWFCADFFAPQPFMDFGIRTDEEGHPRKCGVTVANLVVTGDILAR